MMEEKVKEILINQDKQLEADAIMQVIQEGNNIPTREKIENAKEKLVDEKRNEYSWLENKRIEENKKYTQTFREEIKREQERLLEKRRKQKKMEKAITIYEKHKEDFLVKDSLENKKKKKSFLEKIKEFFLGREEEQIKEPDKTIKPKTHREFEQELKNAINKEFRQEIEDKIAKREELLANEQNRKKNNQTER